MDISSKTVDEIGSLKEKENLKKLEAVFFVSGNFLNMQELVALANLNPIVLKDLIEKLQDRFKKNGLWEMDVRQEYSDIIHKLTTGSAEFSKAKQETLVIIAYKQLVKQSAVIKIRGNKSYEHIKKFRQLGLVVAKRIGHTLELSLSEEFYEYFNVHKQEFKNKEMK